AFAIRLLRRRALFLWIDPRFAALSRALAAAAITSLAVSPPFAITSRAVRTAVRAAERPMVRMEVRRCVWRMRFRAERLRFFAGIGANDTRCLNISVLPMSIARASAIMIVTLVASRVLGWLRLSVIGAHFGETPDLDAYLAAFKIPDAIFGLVIALFTHFGYPFRGIHAVAIGVVVGALVMWLVQLPELTFRRTRYSFSLDLSHAGVRDVMRLAGPRTLALGAVQIVFFVDTYLATGMASGSLTALVYANQLLLLPLGVFS